MGEKRPNPDSNEAFKPCDTKDEPRKIFIGGLTRNTSTDVIKSYFGYYGTIIDAIVMVDDEGHSRGFGFVTFDNADCVDKVLQHPVHFLDGKQVDVKRSVPKAMRPPPRQLDSSKKAFLGGLPTDMNEADLREFFSIYGKVTDCVIMYDEKTMKSRGFGFIGFEDETIIDMLLKQQHLQIRHKQVEVKLARPRTHPSVFNAASSMVGGYGASGPMIGPSMPAGMGGSSGSSSGGYDYSGAYSSSYNYGGGGGYGYGPTAGYGGSGSGNGTGPIDPPAKRMRGAGAGGVTGAGGDGSTRQSQPSQQYPYYQGQYNYDAYNSYYNQYGQNTYPNYQYYGGNDAGKDSSSAGGQQPQNYYQNYQNYNYPSSNPSAVPAQSSAGQSGSGSDGSNMNMLMPMMMQSMMFMQQAQSMFQNMMKKDGDQSSGGPPVSQSMENMRALMQQKAAEYIKKK